jgi:hypothetical protein
VGNLARGNNPFLTTAHSVNAQNALALRGAARATVGTAQLTAIGNVIVGPVVPPGGNIIVTPGGNIIVL